MEMSARPSPLSEREYVTELVNRLRALPHEVSWVEFKVNVANPEDIGEYISSLSNAAALAGEANGFLVWGINDDTHEVVGTDFKPHKAKKGGESLEPWLTRSLSPRLGFSFQQFTYEEKPIVLLEAPRAPGRPVQFKGVEFIRVGSHRQLLKDHPQLEQALWRTFDTTPFERLKAAERLDSYGVLARLDY